MDRTAARVSLRIIIVVHRPRIAKPLESIRRDLVVVFMSLSNSVTETCSEAVSVLHSQASRNFLLPYFYIIMTTDVYLTTVFHY
jgi:hypothetical protein